MHYELVKVLGRDTLLSPVQLVCSYRTRDGRALARGIYAVVWPRAEPGTQCYDEQADYYGPYSSWREASAFMRRAFPGRTAGRVAPLAWRPGPALPEGLPAPRH